MPSDRNLLARTLLASAAIALPFLLDVPAVPDTSLINHLAAAGGWGAFVVWGASRPDNAPGQRDARGLLAMATALGICSVFAAQRVLIGQAGATLVLLAATIVMASGWRSGMRDATSVAWAWHVAAVASASIACVQYFAPSWVDALQWLSAAPPGRAVGNVRQPNHLATLLVCAMTMTAWLWRAGRIGGPWACASFVAMTTAVALSASRTGAVALAVLLVWAALDRSLPGAVRRMLAATPLVYGAAWLALAAVASWRHTSFYASERLSTASDPSSSRFAIWSNAWELVVAQPWTGVGWGQFNAAWTFTPFPDRPVAFFDHTHNLPLHLAVEMGVPAALTVLAFAGWAIGRATVKLARGDKRGQGNESGREDDGRGAHRFDGRGCEARGTLARASLALLGVLGVHSLLEYPLWYAYFLLPAAWATGFVLRAGASASGVVAARGGRRRDFIRYVLGVAGVLMVAGAFAAALDHRRVEVIFAPPPGAGSLDSRIATGQASMLFGHHADYAAATNPPDGEPLTVFRRPLRVLVDVRLLTAYVEALHAAGREEHALYAAQRLREFNRPEAQAFFETCVADAAAQALPFQCDARPVPLTWRNMLP